MKLQDLLKDLELGKVYTDKDRKPFKVNEEKLKEGVSVADTRFVGKFVIHILSSGSEMRSAILSKKNAVKYATKSQQDVNSLWNLAGKYKGKEIKEGKLDEAGSIGGAIDMSGMNDSYTAPKRDTEKGGSQAFLQKYSSSEAKAIIDGELKKWASQLRKFEGKVVKDWMSAAKSGQIDFFDIIRGLKTGDVSRAHPYETQFLVSLLTKDKIVDRFRSYFKGKKGKKGRTK